MAGCAEHLKGWAPVITDRVRIVREPVIVPAAAEDHEDEVARPEAVSLVSVQPRGNGQQN